VKNRINAIMAAITAIVFLLGATNVLAGEANVLGVNVDPLGERQFRISVTLSHADTGWDHYANAWQALDENGEVIGERVLQHPHVNEQPFTRSLTLTIPEAVKLITIKGQDLVHGLGGKMMVVEVPLLP